MSDQDPTVKVIKDKLDLFPRMAVVLPFMMDQYGRSDSDQSDLCISTRQWIRDTYRRPADRDEAIDFFDEFRAAEVSRSSTQPRSKLQEELLKWATDDGQLMDDMHEEGLAAKRAREEAQRG